MEHLIRFRTAEGIDGTHVAAGLDDAVAFVERLRNAEGATDVRLFRLTEVTIEFKPYYRVEVGGVDLTAEAAGAPLPDRTPAVPRPTIGAATAPTAAAPFAERGPVPPADQSGIAPPELPEPHPVNGRRLFSRT